MPDRYAPTMAGVRLSKPSAIASAMLMPEYSTHPRPEKGPFLAGENGK